MSEKEEWRPILLDGVHTGYEVSAWGRVRSLHKGNEGKIIKGGEGLASKAPKIRTVWLAHPMQNRSVRPRVDALVANAFLGPKQTGQRLIHKNGYDWDDRLDNLAYENEADPSALTTPFPEPGDLTLDMAKANLKSAEKAVALALDLLKASAMELAMVEERERAQKGA